MANYTITDPETNRTVTLTGDSPPTEAELIDIFSKIPKPPVQQKGFKPIEKTMFPRTTQAIADKKNFAQQGVAGAADVFSSIGRNIASVPDLITSGPQAYLESYGKQKSTATGVPGFAENILRDPLLPVSVATGGGAGWVPKVLQGAKFLPTVGRVALQGATAAAPAAAARQVGQSIEQGKVDILKQVAEAGLETATGAAGQLAGTGLGKGLQSLAKMGLKQNITNAAAKQAGVTVAEGQDEILQNVIKYDLTRNFPKIEKIKDINNFIPAKYNKTGEMTSSSKDIIKKIPSHGSIKSGWKAIADNAKKGINIRQRKVDDIVSIYDNSFPNKEIDVDQVIMQLADQIKQSDKSYGGVEDAAQNWLFDISTTLKNKGWDGFQKPSEIVKIKRFLTNKESGFKAFSKGVFASSDDSMKSRVVEDLYRSLKDKLDVLDPELKELNQETYDLYNVLKAADGVAGSKFSLQDLGRMLTVGGATHFSGADPMLTAGMSAVSGLTPKGTIPQALIKTSKLPLPSAGRITSQQSLAEILNQIAQGQQNGVPISQ